MKTQQKRGRENNRKVKAYALVLTIALLLSYFCSNNVVYAKTADTDLVVGRSYYKGFNSNLYKENLLPLEQQSENEIFGEIVSSSAISVENQPVTGAAISVPEIPDFIVSPGAISSEVPNVFESKEKEEVVEEDTIKEEISNSDAETKKERKERLKKQKEKKKKRYLRKINNIKKSLSPDMNVAKNSSLSEKDFVKLVKGMKYDYTGLYERNARIIYRLAHKYKVNEIFFLGIIAEESGWGKSGAAQSTNNYTSQMFKGKLRHFSTEEECFESTFKNLGENYLTKGGKYYNGKSIRNVNEIYCEPGKHGKYSWAINVCGCMKKIIK